MRFFSHCSMKFIKKLLNFVKEKLLYRKDIFMLNVYQVTGETKMREKG